MRIVTFLLPLIFLCVPVLGNADENGKELSLILPPDSLAQWYKPNNKRQVWLHNMFNLRRDLQAIEQSLAIEDATGLNQWGDQFSDHYRKIVEMVPEWTDDVDLVLLEKLQHSISSRDSEKIKVQISRIKTNCNSCHDEYAALAAALYRSADFSSATVTSDTAEGDVEYADYMQQMAVTVNQIKIALRGKQESVALEAVANLKKQLGTLGNSCEQCHDDAYPRERILGKQTMDTVDLMQTHLESGDIRRSGRALGKAAVLTCARCHSIHRTVSDLKKLFK